MRRSPSPPQPHSQRRSPTQPERAESPPRSFRPTSPHRPPSPSPSRVTSRPLPTRSSTRRMRGGAGIRSHVPMGAVKPSPANPYLQRHSRHGAPVTQHVAPFRSSIHSGPAPLSGQIEDIAGTPMLARAGSRPTGLRESKRTGTPQRGFHRPVGRGQPLVRMPRNQPSLQSRQSFRAPPPGPPAPPQQSLKQSGPLSSQPSVRRLQSTPPSPQPFQQQSPMLSRSASPMHHLSHPPSPLPHRAMSPHGFRPASFQPPVPNANISLATFPPSQNITQYDYTLMEPDPSPMLTNALPNGQIVGSPFPTSPLPYSTIAHTSPLQRPSSPQTQHEIYPQRLPQLTPSSPNLGRTLQNPYLHNVSNTTAFQRSPLPVMPGGQEEISANVQESQMMPQYPTAGLSNALMQNSRLRSASYSFPLQRNANLYTTVLTPPEAAVPLAPSVPSSPQLSPAMLTSQLRNASFASPFQRQPSPTLPGSPAPPPSPQQQGGVRGSSPLLSGGLRTSHIQGSMFKLPGGTLTMSRGPVETPVNTDSVGGVSSGMLSNALQNQSLHRATYRLPDGSFVTRNEPAEHVSGPSPLSSPMLSSALLIPNLRQATYRLPDGTLVTRTESTSAPSLSSSTLSSALLNANVRNASYRLPDSSFLTRPGEQTQNAESSVASPGLSSALMNANLRKAKFQLPEGSSLFSRNQAQPSSSASSGPVLSGALLKTNIRGASYRLPNTSLFKQPGSTDASQSRSLDLSNALRNQNLRSATYRLPDGTLMTRPQPASAPKALDLSNALSKNPNLRGAKYRLPDGNIMTRLGAPKAPEPRSLNLSGALQNPHLRGASFRLPSSYAVVSPQVQGSGPRQHWAQNAGVEAQQDEDVWGAERVLPHGTVQNLNKWSMYGEGELLDPRSLMGQEGLGNEQGEWNLSREGEPHGQWFDKVISKNECGMTQLSIHNG
ncbi:verprolin-like [Simochromis diagramma]|uniref:verprolin-like n=1 Tax=Simochromis diagramma TaxID=43689 RepID=UPI001A7E78E2|nr:verprolin-like [Simochromis diagramma]